MKNIEPNPNKHIRPKPPSALHMAKNKKTRIKNSAQNIGPYTYWGYA